MQIPYSNLMKNNVKEFSKKLVILLTQRLDILQGNYFPWTGGCKITQQILFYMYTIKNIYINITHGHNI